MVWERFLEVNIGMERISMILDPQEEESEYIEDCEVCCRPIELFFKFSDDTLVNFEAKKMEGI